jgi:hypothetical protein
MENIKKILVQIFSTKIGLFVVSLLLAFLFGVLSNVYEIYWAEIAMYISLIYPVVLIIIAFIYGLIINPYREYQQYKKLRDDNK